MKKIVKKPAAAKAKMLKIVKNDAWLEPYNDAIQGRHDAVLHKIDELTGGKTSLSDFADGHLYFGLHKTARQWVSVSGRRMPRRFILSEILMDGRRARNIASVLLAILAIGN